MKNHQIINQIDRGNCVFGTMLTNSISPRWASHFENIGLDYVVIDTEHSPYSRSEVANLVNSFNLCSVAPIVRIPIPSSHYVTMNLDAGAAGILAPYCESKSEVEEIVGAVKWKPLKGKLLDDIVKKNIFPSEKSKTYLENLNKNNICIIGIESVPAIENLENILTTKGIDAIFVGPNDLSVSLGIPNEYENKLYEDALKEIILKCESANTPVMIHHQTTDLTNKWIKNGAHFVLYTSDKRTSQNGFIEEFKNIKDTAINLGKYKSINKNIEEEIV
tara:strand:- start:102 stop:929 length:828 start_codon:yes stop_codon:yes gene_type:complete